MAARMMKIGVYATSTGAHIAGWRHPDAYADLGANIQHCAEVAQIAEKAKFDFIFYADSTTMRGDDWDILAHNSNRYTGQFEPITLLAALAMATKRLGLIATAQTTYDEPYHVARRFASLDLISNGRIGWNLVTSSNIYEAFNFGAETHMDHGDRYDRAFEFAQVVKGLWETWEDGAFVRDKASGLFFDPEKMHLLNHKGEHFSVRGPLNVPRSPQGHPVVVQAGASEMGKELAAQTAEVIFSALAQPVQSRERYADIKGRMAKYGRAPEELVIMPGLSIFVAETEAEAREKFERVQSLMDPVVGRAFLEHTLNTTLDPKVYPDDGPLPDLPESNTSKSLRADYIDEARRHNLTIRQLYQRHGAKGGATLVGTGKQVADQMEALFSANAADGFILMVPFFPGALQDIIDLVVPELRRRGLFRTEYEGTTLRENLGLPFPVHPAQRALAVASE